MPTDLYDRARARLWRDHATAGIIPAMHRFLQFQPMSDKEGLARVRQEFLDQIATWAKGMDPEGPFF